MTPGTVAPIETIDDIAPLLREARAALGWTVEEAAERSRISKTMLEKAEDGTRTPHLLWLLWLLDAYDIGLVVVKR